MWNSFSSRFAFLKLSGSLLSAPLLPICSLCELYSTSMFVIFLTNSFSSWDLKALPWTGFHFLRYLRVEITSTNLVTSSISFDILKLIVVQLLLLSIAKKYGSLIKFTLYIFPLAFQFVFLFRFQSRSAKKFLVHGKWYFEFLPEHKQTVQVLLWFSVSLHTQNHQKMVFLATNFVEPGWPECILPLSVSSVFQVKLFCRRQTVTRNWSFFVET